MRSTSLRRVALGAATALVVGATTLTPATPAQAADEFAITGVTGIPATTSLAMDKVDLSVSLTFTGPTSSDIEYLPEAADGSYETVSLVQSNSGTAESLKPQIVVTSSTLAPGTPVTYTLRIYSDTQPGIYDAVLPITQKDASVSPAKKTQQVATVRFTVNATAAVTLAQSTLSGGGKFSKKSKWAWSFAGPDYLKGATIKVYYKASGKKKYIVAASAKLGATGDASFKGKKGAIRKKGKAYFVIGAVPFSPAAKSGLYAVKKV